LTPGLGEVMFWLFLTGLLLLLVYMSVLAMRLSGRGRKVLGAVDARLPKRARKVLRQPEAASPEAGTNTDDASQQQSPSGLGG
jgi:ribose 1,5-bisphosphokinase PhnN